jgi:hypothetical protein
MVGSGKEMTALRLALPIAAGALVACAGTQPIESARGIALRIDDSVDALEAAQDQAEDHCRRYHRFPLLQSVDPVEQDRLLASFECALDQGGGVAIYVGGREEDVREAAESAEAYCRDYARAAVLQSISQVGDQRVATFACLTGGRNESSSIERHLSAGLSSA